MDENYLAIISLTETVHRQVLELMKLELERRGIRDITNVQAMMLFNIGDAKLTVGELTLRGCYIGTNASYNLKKMVENHYLELERSVHDRRSVYVQLTKKGHQLQKRLAEMHTKHLEMLEQFGVTDNDLAGVVAMLRRLESFWINASDLSSRSRQFAA